MVVCPRRVLPSRKVPFIRIFFKEPLIKLLRDQILNLRCSPYSRTAPLLNPNFGRSLHLIRGSLKSNGEKKAPDYASGAFCLTGKLLSEVDLELHAIGARFIQNTCQVIEVNRSDNLLLVSNVAAIRCHFIFAVSPLVTYTQAAFKQ